MLSLGVFRVGGSRILFAHRCYSSFVPVKKVGVVGLGLMGHGIAQLVAQSGIPVVAVETEQSFLDKGFSRIKSSVEKIAEKQAAKGTITKDQAKALSSQTLERITGSTNKQDLKDCDIVIEAIVENLDAKKALVRELDGVLKQSAIIASNTSSLSITEIAEATNRRNQVVGVHFFNPVQIMGLVEVIKTQYTSEEVFQATLNLVKETGKVPVKCKDTPGFIVNRLLVPYLAQSLLLLDRGDGTKEDIDTGMKLGAGHPMGPITLADYVGLDTTLSILEGWVQRYPNESAFVIPKCLKQKVSEGKLGRKTGEGFYKWQGDKVLV